MSYFLQHILHCNNWLRPAFFENLDHKPKTVTHRVGGGEENEVLNFIFRPYIDSSEKIVPKKFHLDKQIGKSEFFSLRKSWKLGILGRACEPACEPSFQKMLA